MAATAVMTAPTSPVAPAHPSDRPLTPEPAAISSYIIFDWDDTILASTWLNSLGMKLDEPAVIPKEIRDQLDTLAASACALLRSAMKVAPVCIITNAETGWVQLSARRFLPSVVDLLSEVTILSARSTFEPVVKCPSEWKVRAFHAILCQHYSKVKATVHRNVISFGDSIHERHAVHKVTAGASNTLTKSIKFVERPCVDQLTRQLDLVSGCLGDIVSHRGNLDLMLTIQLLGSA